MRWSAPGWEETSGLCAHGRFPPKPALTIDPRETFGAGLRGDTSGLCALAQLGLTQPPKPDAGDRAGSIPRAFSSSPRWSCRDGGCGAPTRFGGGCGSSHLSPPHRGEAVT